MSTNLNVGMNGNTKLGNLNSKFDWMTIEVLQKKLDKGKITLEQAIEELKNKGATDFQESTEAGVKTITFKLHGKSYQITSKESEKQSSVYSDDVYESLFASDFAKLKEQLKDGIHSSSEVISNLVAIGVKEESIQCSPISPSGYCTFYFTDPHGQGRSIEVKVAERRALPDKTNSKQATGTDKPDTTNGEQATETDKPDTTAKPNTTNTNRPNETTYSNAVQVNNSLISELRNSSAKSLYRK